MKRYLVPVDLSDVTHTVIQTAIATADQEHARIFLLHVVPPESDLRDLGRTLLGNLNEPDKFTWYARLKHLADHFKEQGHDVLPFVASGSPGQVILEMAETEEVDMIVIGTHGHGALYDVVVGSVSEDVLRHSKCPVLIVPRHVPNSSSEAVKAYEKERRESAATELEHLADQQEEG